MAPSQRSVIPAILTVIACASVASAQDEAGLKSAFERQRVTVRIDMPGADDGVDIRVQTGVVSGIAMDLQRYRNDLKRYGTAIRAGDSAMITLIKVKKDLIEVQLDGGGFGTFGDDSSTTSNIPLVDKTDREKTLERELKDREGRRPPALAAIRARPLARSARVPRTGASGPSASATRHSSGNA